MDTVFESPIGPLYLEAFEPGISFLGFTPPGRHSISANSNSPRSSDSILQIALRALEDYFRGNSQALDSLPVQLQGTEFQRAVWLQARKIPFGETISYGELAARIGRPLSSRAVGAALGANPVCIIIPCHRIVSAVGKLHGFSGGLDRKAKLLRHENADFTESSLVAQISAQL